MWYEIDFETSEGQTSFIKPSNFPDIPDSKNCWLFFDGRKLPDVDYKIECDGALVVVKAPWPPGLEIVIRYLG